MTTDSRVSRRAHVAVDEDSSSTSPHWPAAMDSWPKKILDLRHGGLAIDILLVVLLPIAVLALWGAQQWVEPYTPDSEFYFSLGQFTSDVSDRALQPRYFWTRTGVIGPVHLLSQLFGWSAGYLVWRVILLILTVLPFYLIIKPRFGRAAGGAAVLTVATNTVILMALADTYTSSATVAGISLLVGFGFMTVLARRQRVASCAAAGAGAAVGWLPMVSLQSVISLASISLVLIAATIWTRRRQATRYLLIAAVSAAAVFSGFLLWTAALFPGLNWIQTSVHSTTGVDLESYHEPNLDWLWSDPGLLVLPVALIIGFVAMARTSRAKTPIAVSLAILAASALAATAQQTIFRTSFLQNSFHYSQLWPAALLVVLLSLLDLTETRKQRLLILLGATIFLPLAGHSDWQFSWYPAGISLAIAAILLVALVASRRPGTRSTALVVAVALAVPCALQLEQNALLLNTKLIITRHSPSNAYAESDYRDLFARDLEFERWFLASTQPDENAVAWSEASVVHSPVSMLAEAGFAVGPGEAVGPLNPHFVPQPDGTFVMLTTDQYLRLSKAAKLLLMARDRSEVKRYAAAVSATGTKLQLDTCADFGANEQRVSACLFTVTANSR